MKRAKGFTLIEILIVLAIIGILAAILFPVFKGVKERANQTACTSNLQQIGLAVSLYRNDEKQFPSSLAFLLPNDAKLSATPNPVPNTNGTGYLKSTSILLCQDDDNDDSVRSSYGDISIAPPTSTTVSDPSELSRLVWNYYGYDDTGLAYVNATAALNATSGAATPNSSRLSNSALGATYDPKTNPIKYSLSNRFAPADTIITRCIFHRPQTSDAADVSSTPSGARDIILRIDGAAKSVDVSTYSVDNWHGLK